MMRISARVSLFALTLALALLASGHPLVGQSCGPGLNAIACENALPGAPASEWDVTGAGDASIQGFVTSISVNHGETVRFKISTNAASYRLDIYRLGYYDGLGARKIVTVTPSAALPQTQPACLTDSTTGLVDCGNWIESASWPVPASAVSGVYVARLVRNDTLGASHAIFVVRDDERHSALLFQTSDPTWQAYNSYGGNSLYVGAPAGRAYKVSYNRPLIVRGTTGGPQESGPFSTEYPMIRWLEANGYDVSYSAGVDTDRRAAEILEHQAYVSVGHDEYWSAQQRANVEAARGAGVNLAFFSGNEMFWKTRWENSIDGSGTPYRTLVCYKETLAGAKIDPSPAWTGTWRDPRFPSADGGRPENAVTGTLFMVNGVRNDAMQVPAAEGKMRFWRATSIATLAAGQVATLPTGTLGYEWDEVIDNGVGPAGLIKLSSTTLDVTPLHLQDYGGTFGAGTSTHSLTLYRHASGALVFGAGTVQWPWGLDATHDRAGTPADQRMQQATVNLFADMGVQPVTLKAGLVSQAGSADTLAPSSAITSPAAGGSVQSGAPVVITGTATENGGGAIAAVEVSTDNGATWHFATGRTNWTYVWTPFTPGSSVTTVTLRSRAVDDSANLETPGASNTVSINPGPGLVASYGFEEGLGTLAADRSGNANNGTVAGPAWTAAGKYGGALSFDGVNDLVNVADSATLDLTSAMTLEAWIFPTANGGWRTTMMKETTGGLVYSLYSHEDAPRPVSVIRVAAGEVGVFGTSAIPLNSWTHLAATYDAQTLTLYVNGVEVREMSFSGPLATSSGALRLGGNTIWGEFFQGSIDEVRIYGRVLAASEIQADMNTPVGGTPVPDTAPPTAAMTAPASGAVVNAAITVSATASDNKAVAGVQFLLDGNPVGAEDLVAPYSINWDSRTTTDGAHTLAARARDAAGNTGTSTAVSVTVANAPDTTPPTVSIGVPAGGSTVTGTISVTATASDNVAVAGVQFLLDGAALGTEDTISPFAISWDSATTTNGSHLLSARARDAGGNQTTSGAISITVSNAPPPSGLVAAYSFSEGSGTSTADQSGNGRIGTVSGPTWSSAGKYGNALSFDGVNDLVTVADANVLDLTTGMTLEAWVNPAVLSGWRSVILKETTGNLVYSLYAHDNAPRPTSTIIAGGVEVSAPGTAALPVNAWSHLAATYDGATLRLFLNGVQVSSRAATGAISTSTGALRVGGNTVWGEYFQGTIDEVRIFNRARTANEIQTDMNTPVDAALVDTTPPTAPASLTASDTIGSISLAWTAATDNVGVSGYNVHRGTTAGFTPSPANRIAQPAGTSYTDPGLATGTHYYIVAARDAAGNVGPFSNQASAAVVADTTPPTVALTAPSGGTVSNTIAVSATASDNAGVAGVQFLLDGAVLGAEDMVSPYTISWNTRAASNGPHSLAARARDGAGNWTTSASLNVTVSNTVVPGLIAALGFNEGTGTTTADASAGANHGTIAGAAWTAAGKFGSALSFNGGSSWVTVADANSLDLTTGMTLEAWVNPAVLSGWRSAIVKEGNGGLSYSLYAHDNAPRPAATIVTTGLDQSALGSAALPLNVWTHLAATYDGTTLRLFVNGVQVGTRAVTGALLNTTGALRIGGNAIWGEYFSGLMDEIRIYNRALTASEIQTDMNAPIGG